MEEKEQHVQRQGVASHPRLAQCDLKVTAEEAGEGQILKDLNRFVKSVGFLRRHTGEPLKSVREGSNRIQFAFQKGHSGRSSEGRTCRHQEAINLLPKDVRAELTPEKTRCVALGGSRRLVGSWI